MWMITELCGGGSVATLVSKPSFLANVAHKTDILIR